MPPCLNPTLSTRTPRPYARPASQPPPPPPSPAGSPEAWVGIPASAQDGGRVLQALAGHPAHPCSSPGAGRLRGCRGPAPCPQEGEGRGCMQDPTMARTRPPCQAPCPSTLQAGPWFLPPAHPLSPMSPFSPMPLPHFPAWHQFPLAALRARASQQGHQEAGTQQASTQTCRPPPRFTLTPGHQSSPLHPAARTQGCPGQRAGPVPVSPVSPAHGCPRSLLGGPLPWQLCG